MGNSFRTFGYGTLVLLSALVAAEGCHAQKPAPGDASISPAIARRIEVVIRSRASLPSSYDVQATGRRPSAINGYDEISVVFTPPANPGEPPSPPKTMKFLLSKDEKTLAQLNTFDISQDPKTIISDAGRPGRDGVQKAPVTVVVFDDLQCPYCARMHAQLFPAITARYGKNVRVVYKDFPLSQHAWAVHAAIDTGCLAAQSGPGYWQTVDYIHAHGSEIAADAGTPEKTLAQANTNLDKIVRDEAARQKADLTKLNACIAKQDDAPVNASIHEGEALGVDATPILFVNGEKINGIVPLEFLDREIDRALVVEGVTPPPAAAAPAPPAATGTKGGN